MTFTLIPSSGIRAIEAAHVSAHPRAPLMPRAGKAVAHWALTFLKQRKSKTRNVLILAGPGNNGGDAWLAAQLLAEGKCHTTVLALGEHKFKDPAAKQAQLAYKKSGLIVRTWADVAATAYEFDLIIDGLFGSGLRRAPSGAFANTIRAVNESRERHGTTVLAIDVPSGLDADNGFAFDPAIVADHTLTFIAHKPGLHTGAGVDHVGLVELDTLGVDVPISGDALLDHDSLAALVGPRRRNVHKGSFGDVGIIGGAEGMVGAAILAARAALHMGPGKVLLGLVTNERVAYDPLHPEIMMRDAKLLAKDETVTAYAVGMGMGDGGIGATVLHGVITSDKPTVLDADALITLVSNPSIGAAFEAKKAGKPHQCLSFVFTPHPGEAARLLKISTADVQADRIGSAKQLAVLFQSIVVLKGAGTVIATPDGRYFINPTGNPGMASGGMGDALSGMIAGFLAQGMESLDAAKLAVYLHGAAADAALEHGMAPRGLTASEVIFEARMLLNSGLEHGEH